MIYIKTYIVNKFLKMIELSQFHDNIFDQKNNKVLSVKS